MTIAEAERILKPIQNDKEYLQEILNYIEVKLNEPRLPRNYVS